jgi:hypothetical protein
MGRPIRFLMTAGQVSDYMGAACTKYAPDPPLRADMGSRFQCRLTPGKRFTLSADAMTCLAT